MHLFPKKMTRAQPAKTMKNSNMLIPPTRDRITKVKMKKSKRFQIPTSEMTKLLKKWTCKRMSSQTQSSRMTKSISEQLIKTKAIQTSQ